MPHEGIAVWHSRRVSITPAGFSRCAREAAVAVQYYLRTQFLAQTKQVTKRSLRALYRVNQMASHSEFGGIMKILGVT